jgi:hypothetical protein
MRHRDPVKLWIDQVHLQERQLIRKHFGRGREPGHALGIREEGFQWRLLATTAAP